MVLREKQVNLLDDEGVILAFDATPPKRVVSLIPSMTESLFDLGVGDRVVGRNRPLHATGRGPAAPAAGGRHEEA